MHTSPTTRANNVFIYFTMTPYAKLLCANNTCNNELYASQSTIIRTHTLGQDTDAKYAYSN
jgi:hypothetical protein